MKHVHVVILKEPRYLHYMFVRFLVITDDDGNEGYRKCFNCCIIFILLVVFTSQTQTEIIIIITTTTAMIIMMIIILIIVKYASHLVVKLERNL